MHQRDYILRMIEQFGQFAIALRKLITGERSGGGDVQQQLRSLAQHASFDLDTARVLTADSLMLMLAPAGDLEPARCWMVAETLFLDGLEAQLNEDRERAWDSYGKARALFAVLAPHGAFVVGFPEAANRVAEIDRRLGDLDDGGDEGGGGDDGDDGNGDDGPLTPADGRYVGVGEPAGV
jgi:hypothetical protein